MGESLSKVHISNMIAGSVFVFLALSITLCHPLPLPSLLHHLQQEQGGHPQPEEQGDVKNVDSEDPALNENILAFEEFANTKESLLTAQSESLAAEMKDLEKEMEDKLKLLEDQFQTKLKEEQNLRSELLQRKGNPDWEHFTIVPERESSQREEDDGVTVIGTLVPIP